jgi:hypothetical protein
LSRVLRLDAGILVMANFDYELALSVRPSDERPNAFKRGYRAMTILTSEAHGLLQMPHIVKSAGGARAIHDV